MNCELNRKLGLLSKADKNKATKKWRVDYLLHRTKLPKQYFLLIDKWTEIVLDQDNLSECIHSWFSKFGQGATVTPTYHSSQIAKLVTLVATFILADMNEVPTDMSHLICFYFYIVTFITYIID